MLNYSVAELRISKTFAIFAEKHKEMKMISFDDFQDKYIGKIGTPQRDTLEKLVKEAVQHHLLDSFQIAKSIEYSRIH